MSASENTTLSVRLGKIKPEYFSDPLGTSPYSTHEKVPLHEKILPALTLYHRRITEHYRVDAHSRCNEEHMFLPPYVTTMEDCRNVVGFLYSAEKYPSLPFCWYLNTLEFYYSPTGFYKFWGIVDIDLRKDDNLSEFHSIILEELASNPAHAIAWFTGKKGFRIVFYPTPDYPMLAHCNDCPTNHYNTLIRDPRLKERIDPSIYIKGHGVKFDLLYHPTSLMFPCVLTKRSSYNLVLIAGTVQPPSEYLLCLKEIVQCWIEVFTVLGGVIPKLPRHPTKLPLATLIRDQTTIMGPIDITIRVQKSTEQLPGELMKITDGLLDTMPAPYVGLSFVKPQDDVLVVNTIHSSKVLCPIHNKKHSSSHNKKNYIVFKKGCNYYSIRCHASGSLQEKRVNLQKQTTNPPKLTGFTESTKEEVEPFTHYIEKDFLGDLLLSDQFKDKDLLFVRSPMGSGKTVAIASLIESLQPQRILVISTRRTCMMMLSSMFGVAKYIEAGIVRSDLHLLDKVVVSMESLHRVCVPGSLTPILKGYDLILLDECESVFANFNSDTMLHRRNNYAILLQLILFPGTKTIFTDAFLGELTMQFHLRGILPAAPSLSWALVLNGKNQSQATYELFVHEHAGYFLSLFKKDIREKKRIMFASDRIDVITFFQTVLVEEFRKSDTHFNKEKMLVITAGSPKEVIESSSDCVSWEKYDYIFYSPAVTVGNSYSPEDPSKIFDGFYAVFSGNTTTLESIQMTGRARKLKNNKVRVLFAAPIVSGDVSLLLGGGFSPAHISSYIEERLNKARDDIKSLVVKERALRIARQIARENPSSVLEESDRILILPSYSRLENIEISPPLSHLEALFTINIVNSRKSRFAQEDQWKLYLQTTGLSYKLITPPPPSSSEKKKPLTSSGLLSIVREKKKKYLERRKQLGDPYISEILYPSVEISTELKASREEQDSVVDTTYDGLHLKSVRTLLGEHMSKELEITLDLIERGLGCDNFNWIRLSEFIQSHVSVNVWERFYFLIRNIEKPPEELERNELTGSVFSSSATEFYGKASLILRHNKPFYDLFMGPSIAASTTNSQIKPYIERVVLDDGKMVVYLNITRFCLTEKDRLFRLISDYLLNAEAFKETAFFFDALNSLGDHYRHVLKYMLRDPPPSSYEELRACWESEMGCSSSSSLEGRKEKNKPRFETQIIKLLEGIIAGPFSYLFGAFFERISFAQQKSELANTNLACRIQGHNTLRLKFLYSKYWNSKELALFVIEDSKQISAEYPFHDYIQ